MYCWLQEREALTKWPSTYSVRLTESMDRICSLKTMLCIIVPESHSIIKPIGDLNKYPLLAEQLFRTAVSSVHQRRRSKTINEFWNFFLRWILKLILKMSQNKTEITHKFKLCTTFQTRKKEAFACWSKIYFFLILGLIKETDVKLHWWKLK